MGDEGNRRVCIQLKMKYHRGEIAETGDDKITSDQQGLIWDRGTAFQQVDTMSLQNDDVLCSID